MSDPLIWGGSQGCRPPSMTGVSRGRRPPPRFLQDDYSIQVSINDHLDIYCPHYSAPTARPESFTLFMVDADGFRRCSEGPAAFKRWECKNPFAPFVPVRFSEKIQRFTPFSLGFEFRPGETYYYICEW
ncbi:ephrin-A4-like, partial [Meleagris gallopavo]|uniref:ephrin-A4-like n=1 Tax=Meleagris gallopavo TaxID=9103 RepID=UPI0012ABDE0A